MSTGHGAYGSLPGSAQASVFNASYGRHLVTIAPPSTIEDEAHLQTLTLRKGKGALIVRKEWLDIVTNLSTAPDIAWVDKRIRFAFDTPH